MKLINKKMHSVIFEQTTLSFTEIFGNYKRVENFRLEFASFIVGFIDLVFDHRNRIRKN